MILDEKNFQTNVEAFARTNPKAAIELSYTDCHHLEFCHSTSGELNVKFDANETSYFIHSRKSPSQEALQWFNQLKLEHQEVIYIFGVGLGYYYDAVKPWLKKNKQRHVVFLEDDLSMIHRLLETENGTRIISDPQVHLHYFNEVTSDESSFEWLYWNFIQKQIVVSALGFYAKARSDIYSQLAQKVLYESANKNDVIDEYLKYGISFFRNFYPNILKLSDSYLGNSLFGKFRQVPAIICGAGPSLKKNISFLKKLEDRALIFAGGSAINALNAANLSPHFGAGIDPNQDQYQRFSTNSAFNVPFFYRNRLQQQAFSSIHGPKLYITGSGGYDVAEWFEKELGISSPAIDEGHNVVNLCTEIAFMLGCNPIIFVGLDLAFTNMQAYASGVVQNQKVTKKEILESSQFESKAIRWKNIHGKPVYTLWKWLAEAEWLSEFASKHPEITVINSTEGGIGFEGVPNLSLENAASLYLHRSYDLPGRIHGEIQNASMSEVTEKKIKAVMETLQNSLKNSLSYLEILIQELSVVKEMITQEKDLPLGFHTGKSALAETELMEEPAYHAILEIFNAVYLHVHNHQLRILSSHHQRSPKRRHLKLLDLHTKRYHFLKETAQVNLFLIDQALKGYHEENSSK